MTSQSQHLTPPPTPPPPITTLNGISGVDKPHSSTETRGAPPSTLESFDSLFQSLPRPVSSTVDVVSNDDERGSTKEVEGNGKGDEGERENNEDLLVVPPPLVPIRVQHPSSSTLNDNDETTSTTKKKTTPPVVIIDGHEEEGGEIRIGSDEWIAQNGGIEAQYDPSGQLKRRSGVCKFFNSSKGFGFVLDHKAHEIAGAEVFVHYTAIQTVQGGPRAFKSLLEGEEVTYSIVQGPKGWQAQDVTGPNGRPCIGSPAVLTHHHNQHQYHKSHYPPMGRKSSNADVRNGGSIGGVGGRGPGRRSSGVGNGGGGGGGRDGSYSSSRGARLDSGFYSSGMTSPIDNYSNLSPPPSQSTMQLSPVGHYYYPYPPPPPQMPQPGGGVGQQQPIMFTSPHHHPSQMLYPYPTPPYLSPVHQNNVALVNAQGSPSGGTMSTIPLDTTGPHPHPQYFYASPSPNGHPIPLPPPPVYPPPVSSSSSTSNSIDPNYYSTIQPPPSIHYINHQQQQQSQDQSSTTNYPISSSRTSSSIIVPSSSSSSSRLQIDPSSSTATTTTTSESSPNNPNDVYSDLYPISSNVTTYPISSSHFTSGVAPPLSPHTHTGWAEEGVTVSA